jgi:hypothetical protein
MIKTNKLQIHLPRFVIFIDMSVYLRFFYAPIKYINKIISGITQVPIFTYLNIVLLLLKIDYS